MPNRLRNATSPYLLQHADNPVDWYEWGEEAFSAAKSADRPILLSVGYAACHWCHVMAHESFEDEATADYMNRNFINVKVDREERPDVDRIYMDAVQAMAGHGGWPMTVFLTPGGEPFFAGTYYPPTPRGHYPSFMQVLTGLAAAWSEKRDEISEQAANLTKAVRAQIPPSPVDAVPDLIENAIAKLESQFDTEHGGFGGAPKFPQAATLELLLRVAATSRAAGLRDRAMAMLTTTLDNMASGGIYDHLYGGFARYSVDAVWLVPHFEKMLYDNALLGRIYANAWRLTGNAEYARVASEVLDYLVRDMRNDAGGMLAAEDADSEGHEGRFATWTEAEFRATTGADADVMAALYGVTVGGNFEGVNILQRFRPFDDVAAEFSLTHDELRSVRTVWDAALVAHRRKRVPPAVDDKSVIAWNGLALRAFAEGAIALDRPDYLEVAVGIAEFITNQGMDPAGRLVRSWRAGRVSGPGFCDDYAAAAVGMFALYQAGGDERWYRVALELTDDMIRLFADPESGGFHAVGSDAPPLIAKPKNFMDNPAPSDNALAAEALAIRAAYTAESEITALASGAVDAAGLLLTRHPGAVAHLLATLAVAPLRQVAIAAATRGDADSLLETFNAAYRPDYVLAVGAGDSSIPLLAGRLAGEDTAMAYVCEGFVCLLPTGSPWGLAAQLAPEPIEMRPSDLDPA